MDSGRLADFHEADGSTFRHAVGGRHDMRKKRWYTGRYLPLTVLIVVVAMIWGGHKIFMTKAAKQSYILGTVDRGDIILQVAATGTLQAVTTVQVGTQVSGTIAELYADFNSEVKQGQRLARLDPALFQTQVEQQEANVRTAEASLDDSGANVAAMEASLEKARVDVLDKQRKMKQQAELLEANLIARDDYDTAQAALDTAIDEQKAIAAQLTSAHARYEADRARLLQAQAALQNARVNLEHTLITSPISGTIISRSVDRGQTVAASFSSPTLFTIAADLTKMQVNADIDEADVGRIRTGMEADFTVDAFPGETFQGTISQIRLAATTVQNVVTYNAIIGVDNPQLKLKPGMTANVKILIERADGVLRIPNAALRFQPGLTEADLEQAFRQAGEEEYYAVARARRAQEGTAAGTSAARGGTAGSGAGPSGSGTGFTPPERIRASSAAGGGSAVSGNQASRRAAVWTVGEHEVLRPVVLRLGLTDGVRTQIVEGNLKQGDKVVTALEADSGRSTVLSSRPPGFIGPMGGIRR